MSVPPLMLTSALARQADRTAIAMLMSGDGFARLPITGAILLCGISVVLNLLQCQFELFNIL